VVEDHQPKKKDRRGRSWDESYDALVEYKKQHGDCNVPARYKEDTALGKWINIQRGNRYCSKKLTPEKKGKLTQLGFNWETKEERLERTWNEFFERLKVYLKMYLDCCVPYRFEEDPSLGKWVARMRVLYKRGTLPAHRKEKLESIRFTWSLKTQSKVDTSNEDEKWFKMYEALLEYSQEQGHCIVPQAYEEDKSLGLWVTTPKPSHPGKKNEA
jgi:hypothetical protein